MPYPEKKQITLAMGNIPDLAQVTASESFEYGTVGGFLNLADYLDWMPNLRSWLDRYEQYRFAYTLLDGSLYMAPKFSTQNDKDIQWGYNEDQLVERSGLPVPGSLEELAEVATQFRDMEPDIYPIVGLYWPGIANGANTALQATLNSMGIGDIDINYFRDEDQFLYTALHPRFKEAVEYVKGLYDEKLISQTYITENYRDWQKLFEAAPNKDGRHTLAPFSAYQINRHANNLRWHEWSVNGLREQWWPEVYPLFLGDRISLPLAQPLSGSSLDPDGLAVSKALESEPTKLAKTLAFVDWLYSEDGVRWINYGQEGEHYDLVGGEVDVRPEYTGNTPEFYERDGRWKALRERGRREGGRHQGHAGGEARGAVLQPVPGVAPLGAVPDPRVRRRHAALAVTGLRPYHGEDRRAGAGQQRDRQVPAAVHGRRAAQSGRSEDQHAGYRAGERRPVHHRPPADGRVGRLHQGGEERRRHRPGGDLQPHLQLQGQALSGSTPATELPPGSPASGATLLSRLDQVRRYGRKVCRVEMGHMFPT